LRWRALAPITKCAPCRASFKELQTSALDNTSSALLMTIPGNPDYFSLNVASAIQVFAYQNYVYNTTTQFEQSSNEIASFDELEGFYTHLAQAL
jgi:tRNA C32,U32 (ribose-2'-O)-methylase TrmJ